MKIDVIRHASIKFSGDKIIYFDPYKIEDELHDADYIFITHDHYDHYDEESINNIKKDTTKIIVPKCLEDKENYLVVEPNNTYTIDDMTFDTIPSYNLNKPFHPKEKGYVSYNVNIDDTYYYVMGDTDVTEESKQVKTDICFIPIGGVYTMDVYEAIDYINKLKPNKAIPIHYGLIVGDSSLKEIFEKGIEKEN
jgi:L-ascorbate metabolism protein UlaG (beta-lactamase superfamily)